jgi:sugar phosphate permease
MVALKPIISRIFKYPYIWLLAYSCFVISMVRTNIIDWKMLYLQDLKATHYSFLCSLWIILEILIAGWCSDKIFCGRRWKTNLLFHLGMIFLLLAFWFIPTDILSYWYGRLLAGMSFFIYGYNY